MWELVIVEFLWQKSDSVAYVEGYLYFLTSLSLIICPNMKEKIFIACELLNSALKLYYEENSYYSALHLAGGAEEILRQYVVMHGGDSSSKILHDFMSLSNRLFNDCENISDKDIYDNMNHAKNETKHVYSFSDIFTFFNPKEESQNMIDRAITNLYYINNNFDYDLEENELIFRFCEEFGRR